MQNNQGMQDLFLNLEQPVLLPVPPTQYILAAAGIQDLTSRHNITRVAAYATGKLNAHPLLLGVVLTSLTSTITLRHYLVIQAIRNTRRSF